MFENILYSFVYVNLGVGVWAASNQSMTIKSNAKFTTTAVAGTLTVTDNVPNTAKEYIFDVSATGSDPTANTSSAGEFASLYQTAYNKHFTDSAINEATATDAQKTAAKNAGNAAVTAVYNSSHELTLSDIAFTSSGSDSMGTTMTYTIQFDKTSNNAALFAAKLTAGDGDTTIADDSEIVIATNNSTIAVGTEIVSGTASGSQKTTTEANATNGVITAKFSKGTSDTEETTKTNKGYTLQLASGSSASATITVTFTYYGNYLQSINTQAVSIAVVVGDAAWDDFVVSAGT